MKGVLFLASLALLESFSFSGPSRTAIVLQRPDHGSLGLSVEDMGLLTYGSYEIPGFGPPPDVSHGWTSLDKAHGPAGQSLHSVVRRWWAAVNGHANKIHIDCRVFATPKAAQEALSALVGGSAARMKRESFTGMTVGDDRWCNRFPGAPSLHFSLGSTMVSVLVIAGGDAAIAPFGVTPENLVEALALGLEYKVRGSNLNLVEPTQVIRLFVSGRHVQDIRPLRSAGATWAPLSVFERLGAKVSYDKGANAATVEHKGTLTTLRLLQKQAFRGAHKVDLPVPILLGAQGPIVPLRQVAEALGFAVFAEGPSRISIDAGKHLRTKPARNGLRA